MEYYLCTVSLSNVIVIYGSNKPSAVLKMHEIVDLQIPWGIPKCNARFQISDELHL